jgi:N-acetyl-gamma-glutamyl-phosphate reductase
MPRFSLWDKSMADKKIRIAVLGASGYTGAELLRILCRHPQADIAALTAERNAGQPVGAVFPHLFYENLPPLVKIAEVDWTKIDLVFCCLPHGTTQEVIAGLPPHLRIIDLSADFRLADPASYAEWYGHEHRAVPLQKDAVYGLTEINREAIKKARLVANPGCYPTSVQLPLAPLFMAGLLRAEDVIIDSKSGVTGAGREAKLTSLYSEVAEGLHPYGVARHRHTPEIEQGLSLAAGKPVRVAFTPHLIPMNRGMLSTIYVKLAAGKTADDLRAEWQRVYRDEPFIKILPAGATPATHYTRGTNGCGIAVFADRLEGRAIILSVIDNLGKGASGQAVQNMNLMYGLPETTGLDVIALFP